MYAGYNDDELHSEHKQYWHDQYNAALRDLVGYGLTLAHVALYASRYADIKLQQRLDELEATWTRGDK